MKFIIYRYQVIRDSCFYGRHINPFYVCMYDSYHKFIFVVLFEISCRLSSLQTPIFVN